MYKWVDGQQYEGNWMEDEFDGEGVWRKGGAKYVGGFKNGQMHGKGVYTWKDGRKYDGFYLNDKKHGYGLYQWADLRTYEG